MSEQYYVYAFNISDEMVTAALSCPDEKTAKRAYQHARREMELKHGSVDTIIAGYATIAHGQAVQIEYPAGWYAKENRYWMEYQMVEADDFQFAESQTIKNIAHKGCDQWDIVFMRYVQSALTELFLGFAPDEVEASADFEATNYSRQIQAEHNVFIEPDAVGSPPIFIAASAEKKKSALELYNEGRQPYEPDSVVIEEIDTDALDGLKEAICNPVVAAIGELTAIMKEPKPFYQVHCPKDATFEPAVDADTIPTLIAALRRKNNIDHDTIIRGIFEQFPETRTFTASRLLLYYKDFARKHGVEITIGESRIKQLTVWKENAYHRQSSKAQYREEMGDAVDENAVDVNDIDYDN